MAYCVGDVTKEADVIQSVSFTRVNEIATHLHVPSCSNSLFDSVTEASGRVDLVFCNAGISPPSVPIAELSLADWQATIDTNLTGAEQMLLVFLMTTRDNRLKLMVHSPRCYQLRSCAPEKPFGG